MKSARLLVSSIFFATLAGAVGLVALNSRSQELQLRPVSASQTVAKPGAKTIVWEADFESAMRKAKSQNKPILIDFYTDWCGLCKEMDKTVFPDPSVVAESQNWVMVKINGDKRRDVAQAYGVSGFPTVIFAEGSGKPIETVPGFAAAAEFVGLMRGAYSKWTPATTA